MTQKQRRISFRDALNEALRQEMLRDESVIVIGEDVGIYGGLFAVTGGLFKEFGPKRVIDTPISEAGFLGASCTLAATGFRPVVELFYVDFLAVCMDQLWNNIAKMRYQSAGKMKIPLVITASCGVGTFESYQHSQVLYSTIAQIPGIKVVIPSNAYDAKGLLISSIRDDDPVVFLEHKSLLKSSVEENVPVEEYSIPLGKASVRRAGNDITVVAMMLMVNRALEAAKELEKDGISVEVIDPRTIVPFDKETILESLKKTGRLVIVDESHERCGMASQIAAIAAEEAFEYLKAPIRRVASLNVPIPYMQSQIDCVIPTQAKILEAVKRTYKT